MIGKLLKKLRGDKTQEEVAKNLGLSRARYAHYEQGRSEPNLELIEKFANYFGVTSDYLLGLTASSKIDAKLEETGITLEELAEKANVPLRFLQNLDNIVPDQEVDLGEQCYSYISSIAWVLGIPGSELRTAFARQEIPKEQYPKENTNPEDDFDKVHPDIRMIARAGLSDEEAATLRKVAETLFPKAFGQDKDGTK